MNDISKIFASHKVIKAKFQCEEFHLDFVK